VAKAKRANNDKRATVGWTDPFLKVLSILATLIVALVGLNYTIEDQNARKRQTALELLIKVMTLSTSVKTDEQNSSLGVLKTLQTKEFSQTLSPVFLGEKNFQIVIANLHDQIYQQPPQQTVTARPGGEQWIYIGQWDGTTWNTRYLEFKENLKPENLEGKAFEVRNETGALNVRSGPAKPDALMPVVGIKNPGEKVTISKVEQTLGNPHFWGKIN
jgi:hypothetical protein